MAKAICALLFSNVEIKPEKLKQKWLKIFFFLINRTIIVKGSLEDPYFYY